MKLPTTIIDTNIILRLLIDDLPDQAIKSQTLFRSIEEGKQEGLVSILVINELYWVLTSFYEQRVEQCIPLILKLLSLKHIRIMEIGKTDVAVILSKALSNHIDFSDAYLCHMGEKLSAQVTTYDKRLERSSRNKGV